MSPRRSDKSAITVWVSPAAAKLYKSLPRGSKAAFIETCLLGLEGKVPTNPRPTSPTSARARIDTNPPKSAGDPFSIIVGGLVNEGYRRIQSKSNENARIREAKRLMRLRRVEPPEPGRKMSREMAILQDRARGGRS